MARLVEIEAELSAYAESLDPSTLLGSEAVEVVRRLSRMENLVVGMKLKAAARVADTPAWKHKGHRTPAEWLAKETKCGMAEAIGALETGERLADCPKVAEKVRSGELTGQQARALAKAVSADPMAEDRLLGVAATDGLKKLNDECRQVELAGRGDAKTRYDKIHRERSMRHWTDDEGAFRMSARLTPDAGAKVLGALAPFEKQTFDRARLDRRHEPHEAYRADALVGLADASLAGATGDAEKPKSRKPSFTVLVDIQALLRGEAEPGETCEIPGVGPLPVSRLYDLAPEAVWHLLVTNGQDIRGYCSATRHFSTQLRSRGGTERVTPGRRAAERSEASTAARTGGRTRGVQPRIEPIHHDHALKTYKGWTLAGEPDNWTFEPPAPTGTDPP